MSYYAEHFNEIYNAHKAIADKNVKAANEIVVILNGLQGKLAPSNWRHTPIGLLGNKNGEEREVVYDDLEVATIGFMQKYFPEIKLTKVEDTEKWIKEHIRIGRNNHE